MLKEIRCGFVLQTRGPIQANTVAPTGKKGVDISRLVDGKFVEEWQVADSLDFYKQLGVCIKATGTHTGEWHGLAPTGKKITVSGVNIYRIVKGKSVEGGAVDDWIDAFKELGVIDYKGFPDEAT